MDSAKELRWIRILLLIIALAVVASILKTLKSIFIPLIFSIFLLFLFAPLINYLKKHKVPMVLILLITLVIIAVFLGLVILLIYAASNSLINGLPRYEDKFNELIAKGTEYLQNLASNWNINTENISIANIAQIISSGFISIPQFISNTVNTLVSIIQNIFLIIFFLIFLLLEIEKLPLRLRKATSKLSKEQTLDILQNIEKQIQNYLTIRTLVNLSAALLCMLWMLIFGVDFILVCGILLFVLDFIPDVGSVISSAIPILIYLLQSGFSFLWLIFALLIVATQMLIGNIIEPKLQGVQLNLTPIMVLVSLIFWGWLWGIVGMLICVPLTSAINIILKQVAPNNFISTLISSE
ncbi:MAG TPA: AI-2E family transporter [Candidatus Cloacimonas acidaminovorans]|jgi:predicted PurR-regulated permease PerM|nr:AI-2E family transporter [Candidatus Cloacimonas acidaminovorans]HNZ88732.1 AI-2E family transporter [Candidatus Cloacimonas acidaminovorans]HOI02173.1 AI-2E family transporter [Candidatus Cloacimonas acidaminovorans]HPI42080.1 AI-2E family transporter [Candidatus Cloacimonas acidaminovorans]HPX58182.1 AI-2E family transporter [Candidatus Cloacimonas acidaminovorans]